MYTGHIGMDVFYNESVVRYSVQPNGYKYNTCYSHVSPRDPNAF